MLGLKLKVPLYYYLNFTYKYRIINCYCQTSMRALYQRHSLHKRQLTIDKLSFENNQTTMAKSQYQHNFLTGFIIYISMHFNFYLSFLSKKKSFI